MTTFKHITTVEQLKDYLHRAMQLEHATIPPYLLALYSIHPQTNADARHILRVIAVEEMLHLTLAANLLNAVGGEPDLSAEGFVPLYPATLPDGETDFKVGLGPFSRASVETFLNIERPGHAPDGTSRHMPSRHAHTHPPHARLASVPDQGDLDFYSIGEFYSEIRRGFETLYQAQGPALFSGKPERQVTSEYYYSGGAKLHPVTCIDSARSAIDLIIGQGEGDGRMFDDEGELSHYYRFEQLCKGSYYRTKDQPGSPTGPPVDVDWDAVYPIKPNARLSDYADAPELLAGAKAFNDAYADFLAMLTTAFTGSPQVLIPAVTKMFKLRDAFGQLVRHPMPGAPGLNAAPTFEIPGRKGGGQ